MVLNGSQWFPVVLNGSQQFSMVCSGSQCNMTREKAAKARNKFGAVAFHGNIDTGNGCMNPINRL